MNTKIPHVSRVIEKVPTVRKLVEIGVNVNNPGRSQSELARDIGYEESQASMLSLIKSGKSKLPIQRLPKAAAVLRLDPVLLLAAHLKERTEKDPEVWEFIRTVLNGTHDANEEKLLAVVRAVEREKKYKYVMTPDREARLHEFVATQLLLE